MELSARGKSALEILAEIDNQFAPSDSEFIAFHEFGKSRSSVLNAVQRRIEPDLTYQSGKIFGAMTTEPHEFARYVYSRYLERNLGDCGLVPGTKSLEKDLIQILGSLLGDSDVSGNMVSGGTEANIIAMFLAKKSMPQIKNPEIVVPDSAHLSFDKSADLMGLTVKRAHLNADFSLDMNNFESLINDNTIALVGVAGTTALGMIDPLDKIGKLASQRKLLYHVDGAFGGMVFPFLEALGHNLPVFDMRIPEIVTYTIDPHKMGMGVIPGGCLLVRNHVLNDFGFEIPYLAGGGFKSLNILGTRPGASVISFWALMQHLGKEGYKKIVNQCWENTIYLKEELANIPQISLAVEPISPVLGLQLTPQSGMTLCEFDAKMRGLGWALGIFKQWNLARVVLMPHIQREHIDAFLADVKSLF